MAYCTNTEVKAYLKGAATSDDTLLTTMIGYAQNWINEYCNRTFEATTETRYYRQCSVRGQRLFLDKDLISVTSLTNGNSVAIASSAYWLKPRNTPPYQWIELKSSTVWSFDTDGEITVVGSWGYSTTAPNNIKFACIRLTAFLYHQIGSQVYDTTVMPEMGAITIPAGMPKDVKMILDKFVLTTRFTP
jgi:hypothetical protein